MAVIYKTAPNELLTVKNKLKIMKRKIENIIARCVCKGIEMYMKKYRLYQSYYEVIPMTEADFKNELAENNTKKFSESYFERFDKYRI